MTDLEIALAGFCIVLAVDRVLLTQMAARERARLLDRIQARSLPEYKALAERKAEKSKKQRSVVDDPQALMAEPEPVDMRPGLYPQAIEASRSLME